MTKKELMQLYYLNREIMHDTEELVNLKIENRGIGMSEWDKKKEAIIKKAFFKEPSTLDYSGIYNGKYIEFDAKECHNKTSFPL